jgi:tetrahydromethanopterin:alpha-L-glutamate ligase
MKRIGIAVTDPEDWTGQALYEAVIKSGNTPFIFRLHDVTTRLYEKGSMNTGNIDLTTLDAVIVRDMGGGGSEDMSYRFDVLCNLQKSGIPVINPPEAIQTAANKHMSSYIFKEHKLPTPDTVLTADPEVAFCAVRQWGRAVVKPIFGFKGINIYCLMDDNASRGLIIKLLKRKGVLYLQQYIPNPGRDIRVFVVNRQAVGAIYRIASPGSWINNLSRGGLSKQCPLSLEIERLACSAANAVGAVYAGVDLIEGSEGLSILEVNATPSGRGIFDACGIDVTREIVRYVIGNTKSKEYY